MVYQLCSIKYQLCLYYIYIIIRWIPVPRQIYHNMTTKAFRVLKSSKKMLARAFIPLLHAETLRNAAWAGRSRYRRFQVFAFHEDVVAHWKQGSGVGSPANASGWVPLALEACFFKQKCGLVRGLFDEVVITSFYRENFWHRLGHEWCSIVDFRCLWCRHI